MSRRWTCACGAPGVRNVGIRGYCPTCLRDLFEQFSPDAFTCNGVGLLRGRMLPEFGPLLGELECIAPDCSATWVDVPGTPCPWCRDRRHRREAWLEQDARRAVTRDVA